MKIDCVNENNSDYYFLVISNKFVTKEICDLLNIKQKEYIKILQKYGAILLEDLYFFHSYEEALDCLESQDLIPYRMLMEITI